MRISGLSRMVVTGGSWRKDLNAMTRRSTHKAAKAVVIPLGERRAPERRSTLAAAANVAKKTAAAKTAGQKSAQTKSSARAKANKDADRNEHQRLLAVAEARIKELEVRLANVTDRIAWVVDRLHSVLDDNH